MVEIHPWCGPASQEEQMKGCESQTICSTLPLGLQTPIVGHKNPPVGRICDTEVDPYLEPVNFFTVHLLFNDHDTYYDSEVLLFGSTSLASLAVATVSK